LSIKEKMKMKFCMGILLSMAIAIALNTQVILSSLTESVIIRNSGIISQSLMQPLHVEGKYIKDQSGNIIYLRGINKHGFEDGPGGSWQKPDGDIVFDYFDSAIVAANLDAMKTWGINTVRIHTAIDLWLNENSGFRENVKILAQMLLERNMYLIFDGYSVWHYGMPYHGQDPMPFPPYSIESQEGASRLLIPNEDAFVDYWISVANELKAYPNVLFEIWNEPVGIEGKTWEEIKTDWQRVWQKCINAIRQTGATNIIVVQFEYGVWANLQAGVGSDMSWVWEYPLEDPLGNILYDIHLYRENIIRQSEPDYVIGWTYEDVIGVLDFGKVFYVLNTLNKPVLVGEIGPNIYWQYENEIEYQRELAFYNNSLKIFNSFDIHYTSVFWWPSGPYAHLTFDPGYQANDAGNILKTVLSES
jgi:aryl-phospho-beta-D-glucosidase BglC (GH1 family)